MRRAFVAVVALALLVAAAVLVAAPGGDAQDGPAPSPPPATPAPAAPAGVEAHLRALAGAAQRHNGTRAAGTPGYDASVRYVEERLRAAGYRVWRERVRFPLFRELARPRLTGARGRDDVRVLAYSPSGSVTARVRRTGRGCSPGDFAGLRRDEVALAERGVCPFRRKARLAQEAGAAAVLVAETRGGPPVAGTLGSPGLKIPALILSARAARALPSRVSLSVRTRSEVHTDENVLAERGVGARGVMAGAHLDSVPAGPGLNDNGSGVAALLDVAERLAAEPARDRLRLAFWAAEELGLHGSRRHVANLSAGERRDLVAYLNLDMVGSPKPRPEVYAARDDPVDKRLEELLREGLEREGIRPREEGLDESSDHAPFVDAGVPVGGLFTGAGAPADPCYHRACDTLENVDVAMTAAMARAAAHALAALSPATAARGRTTGRLATRAPTDERDPAHRREPPVRPRSRQSLNLDPPIDRGWLGVGGRVRGRRPAQSAAKRRVTLSIAADGAWRRRPQWRLCVGT